MTTTITTLRKALPTFSGQDLLGMWRQATPSISEIKPTAKTGDGRFTLTAPDGFRFEVVREEDIDPTAPAKILQHHVHVEVLDGRRSATLRFASDLCRRHLRLVPCEAGCLCGHSFLDDPDAVKEAKTRSHLRTVSKREEVREATCWSEKEQEAFDSWIESIKQMQWRTRRLPGLTETERAFFDSKCNAVRDQLTRDFWEIRSMAERLAHSSADRITRHEVEGRSTTDNVVVEIHKTYAEVRHDEPIVFEVD